MRRNPRPSWDGMPEPAAAAPAEARRDRIHRLDLAVAGGLVLAVMAALTAQLGELFPLTEFRDWSPALIEGWTGGHLTDLLWQGFTRQIAYARTLPLAYAAAANGACGPQPLCLNLAVLLPVALSAGLFYRLARRLGADRLLTVVGIMFWLLSAPAAQALTWQATIFDRMALLFVLASILVYLRFTATPLGRGQLFACNLLVGALTAAALMSKEIAFPLPAILLLFGLADIGHRAARLRRLSALALPLAYGLFVAVTYLRDYLGIAPTWAEHTLGGDIVANATSFVSGLVPPADRPDKALVAALLVLAAFGMGYGWLLRGAGATGQDRARAHAAGALLLAGLALALPALRTRFAWPFYFYTSQAIFTLSYAVLASAAAKRVPSRGWTWPALAGAALPLILLAGHFLTHGAAVYRGGLVASDNFSHSLERLRSVTPTGGDVVVAVLTPAAFPPHMFVDGSLRGLWRYIAPEVAAGIRAENRVLLSFGAACPDTPWRYCLRFDQMMNLTEIRAIREGARP